MGAGAAQLNTSVQEHNDTDMNLEELSPEIFQAPNVQVGIFGFNR